MRLRPLTSRDLRKRGCEWCLDHRFTIINWPGYQYGNKRTHACIHDICPYRELDEYETYNDYLKHAKNEGYEKLLDSVFKAQRELWMD